MFFRNIVPAIATLQDKKRIASQYVIDYRNLDEPELEAALIKTAPQYDNEDNVRSRLNELMFHAGRDVRVLHTLMLRTILLNCDDFLLSESQVNQAIIDLEQEIVNLSTEELQYKSKEKNRNVELFSYVLEAAWDRNDDISPDEKNLIEKLRTKLRITEREYQILEAKLGKFPKDRNVIHLRDDINRCRIELQGAGLLMCFRTDDRTDFDVIPEETAATLRRIWGIELQTHGYAALVSYKAVRNKQYIKDILTKAGVYYDPSAKLEELQATIVSHVPPSFSSVVSLSGMA